MRMGRSWTLAFRHRRWESLGRTMVLAMPSVSMTRVRSLDGQNLKMTTPGFMVMGVIPSSETLRLHSPALLYLASPQGSTTTGRWSEQHTTWLRVLDSSTVGPGHFCPVT